MGNSEFILPWIEKAESDIASAKFLAENMHPAPVEIIGFHCQQAAEKYLKAFLVYKDQEPPKTHDLIELIKLCKVFNENFTILNPKCEFLIPFAVQARYPGTINPDNEDMKKALAYTTEIINFIKSKISE